MLTIEGKSMKMEKKNNTTLSGYLYKFLFFKKIPKLSVYYLRIFKKF